MAAELEMRKAEFEEEKCRALATHDKTLRDKQAECNAAIHAKWVQSMQQKAMTDAKWAAWVQQLQADQAQKQKEVSNGFTAHIAELQKQRAEQDAWYGTLQQQVHISEPVAQPSALYQSQSSPLVSVQRPLMCVHVSQELQQKRACGAQSPHPLIPSNTLPQVQTVDLEQQQNTAQILLAQKMNEVARLARAVQDSIANPAEVTRLSDQLKIVSRECTRLQAEFQKEFGPHVAVASGAASGATLPTDQNGQAMSRQSGAAGPMLDPSASVFQPTAGALPTGIAGMEPSGVQESFGVGPMTTQEYEMILDPNYVTDQQWECEELQKERDELLQTIE